ncbi:MAG: single-stranded DNA-binding protein [Oscillospiraceae bacterium]|jgi:single-stranded DNA-binding protein|nr:single-stranded DNA-binding protein [Oscillospiraceae bacterium]
METMNSVNANNNADLIGTLVAAPRFSHKSAGASGAESEYLTFPLEVTRLSGVSDIINVIADRTLSERAALTGGDKVSVLGEIRTYNNKSGAGAKLVINVLARELRLTDEPERNSVALRGALCKTPNIRRTPLGREICDLMLAVNRRYGRGDYIPCIAWGRTAEVAAGLAIGDSLAITGRIQSRKYTKMHGDGSGEERTAFEVSIVEFAA